jgi:hypothetical protein
MLGGKIALVTLVGVSVLTGAVLFLLHFYRKR